MIQSMPDASPIRWHLAHTTWFFETFVLEPLAEYDTFDPHFRVLFNSYYNSVGAQFPRAQRGAISRPGLARTLEYRRYVDDAMTQLLSRCDLTDQQSYTIEVGLHHEQQHQELMLTDIKHALSCNPTLPVYRVAPSVTSGSKSIPKVSDFVICDGGLTEIGFDPPGPVTGKPSFCYDNELPRHRVFLEPFQIARQPVSCGQWIEFIDDGGYDRPDHWLSLGWSAVQEHGWTAPLYWVRADELSVEHRRQVESDGFDLESSEGAPVWFHFTLGGLMPVDVAAPVCHVSLLEADAMARWAGARLPTEFEWESICRRKTGNHWQHDQFADQLFALNRNLHPQSLEPEKVPEDACQLMMGSVWEWTSSNYGAYPGYEPPDGALGEYNGKFMCNQYVLRGGSVATSRSHLRPTYRNFFPAATRWQFSGVRLAKSG